jgi:uncharacterized protein (TIGR02246 family)
MDIYQLANGLMETYRTTDSDAYAKLFAEDGFFIDPAYGLKRQGRDLVRLHHHKWLAAVPDWKIVVERVLVDGQSAIVMWEGSGTFSGEPLGAGANTVHPTHKFFKARLILELDFDAAGLIKSCTEYYDNNILPLGKKAPYADDPRGLQ